MTKTETYLEVTLPNGNIVTKKTGSKNYTHALVKGDEVLSWHINEQRARHGFVMALRKLPTAEERASLSVERVRVA